MVGRSLINAVCYSLSKKVHFANSKLIKNVVCCSFNICEKNVYLKVIKKSFECLQISDSTGNSYKQNPESVFHFAN